MYRAQFDFIHGRELEGCIANEDQLFSRAFEHLKPGGYFEFVGANPYFFSDDDALKRAPNCQLLIENIHIAGNKFWQEL